MSSNVMKKEKKQNFTRDSFAIKYNNCAANGVCPICGGRTDPQIPLAVFLRENYHEICDPCAKKFAPEMAAALRYPPSFSIGCNTPCIPGVRVNDEGIVF